MGCGMSGGGRTNGADEDEDELYLPSTELRFNADQMRRLNDNFLRGHENSDYLPTSSTSLNVEAIVHRIVQRLLCGIGILDRRFASKFLITTEPMSPSIKLSKSFSYYVRLDVLSEPRIYEDDFEYQVRCVTEEEGVPQGFSRIRVVTSEPEKWADLTDGDGYLRRDKLRLRFVELLAASASKKNLVGRPEDVDESYLCGCPGKVVDPELLHEILKSPPDEQVFFGMGRGSSKFPDPRDLRIAVVEDAQCVKLRISGPKTSGDVAVVLLPAIEFAGWPKYTDLLSRIPLTHPDILIHQRATTMGYYAVPVAAHGTAMCCHDRRTTWQIRFPAAECLYQTHYSERSVVSNIYHFLRTKVPELRKGDNGVCVVSGHMLKTLLWFRLETCTRVEDWDHRRVAGHVLCVLDALVAALKARRHRSYFYAHGNVVLDAPRAGRTGVPDDDYRNDVEVVEAYLYGLFEKSVDEVAGQAFRAGDGAAADYWQRLERITLRKWRRVLDTVGPRRYDYGRKQLEYVAEVFKGMSTARHDGVVAADPGLVDDAKPGGREIGLDAAYLVSAVVEQALAVWTAAGKRAVRDKRRRRRNTDRDGPEPVRRLLDDVYADAAAADIADDAELVRFVLGRLHTVADAATTAPSAAARLCPAAYWRRSRRHRTLARPLSAFLGRLYDVSHRTCWHLDEWRRRQDRDELRSLGAFARALCRHSASPDEGLLDAVRKGWSWADEMLQAATAFQGGVELVCAPGPGEVRRFGLSLPPSTERPAFASRSLGRAADGRRRSGRADTVSSKFKTVRGTSFLDVYSLVNDEDDDGKKAISKTTVATYARLQRQSPMTSTIASNRYRTNHRVLGNIVNALINLQKYTVLQEMCSVLPEDKQGPVLDDIRKISKERRRRCRRQWRQQPDGQRGAARITAASGACPSAADGLTGVYRSMSELSAPAAVAETVAETVADDAGSLMATVRAARRKQCMSATVVYNPAFYDPPPDVAVPTGRPPAVDNPAGQPYLRMTADNGFSLGPADRDGPRRTTQL